MSANNAKSVSKKENSMDWRKGLERVFDNYRFEGNEGVYDKS